MLRNSLLNVGVITLVGALATTANAQVEEWDGSFSVNWSDNANWADNTAPGANAAVRILSTATNMPVLDGPVDLNSLELQANTQIHTGAYILEINNASGLEVRGGAELFVQNDGELRLQGAGTHAVAGLIEIQAGGQLTVNASPTFGPYSGTYGDVVGLDTTESVIEIANAQTLTNSVEFRGAFTVNSPGSASFVNHMAANSQPSAIVRANDDAGIVFLNTVEVSDDTSVTDLPLWEAAGVPLEINKTLLFIDMGAATDPNFVGTPSFVGCGEFNIGAGAYFWTNELPLNVNGLVSIGGSDPLTEFYADGTDYFVDPCNEPSGSSCTCP